MTLDQVMHYGFWVWMFLTVAFIFFVIGRMVGYREGYNNAKALYKVNWK